MSARLRISWVQAGGASLLAWTALVLLHASASVADQVRRGGEGRILEELAWLAPAYLPWPFFTATLLRVFSERAGRLSQTSETAKLLIGSIAFYFIPQVAYQVALALALNERPGTTFWGLFQRWPAISWLIDFGVLILSFAVVYAFVVIRENRLAEESRRRSEAEKAALQLEIEQHRLRSLRGQLEPHFLFNALNAISSLVRADDKGVALTALQQLSGLLRYALSASGREWVSLGDELDFVHGYLTLQRLRYGQRLRVEIEGDGEDARSTECPPLLLQPLIENAIRHDLERHEGPSDIRMTIERRADRLLLEVVNSVRSGLVPNPGVGLGLKATRDRLSIMYGEAAECRTEVVDGWFRVRLSLPAVRPKLDGGQA